MSQVVPVTDAFGRERTLGVRVADGGEQVLLTPPPGEAVLIQPGIVAELIDALREARAQAYATIGRRMDQRGDA